VMILSKPRHTEISYNYYKIESFHHF
jgi:hypothetical protein